MSAARPIRNFLPGLLVLAGGIYTVYYYYMYWLRVYGALCLPGRGDPVLVEVTRGIWIRLDSLLFPTIFGVFMILLGIMLVWKRKFGVAVLTLVLSAAVINWPGFFLVLAGALLGLVFWRKTLIPDIDLPKGTVDWIAGRVGEVKLKSFKEIPSGDGHRVYEFTNEEKEPFVVKASVHAEKAAGEADALQFAADRGLPAPELAAADVKEDGQPGSLLLMRRIGGGVFLHPLSFDLWADEIADVMGRVHKADPAGARLTDPVPADPVVPEWAIDRDIWQRAADLFAREAEDAPLRFIHGDCEPANILFDDGHVSGIVDWEHAGIGIPQTDIGRMRIALALIHGEEVADRFLKTYRESAGEAFSYSRYWDLRAVYGWLAGSGTDGIARRWIPFGVTTLTEDEVKRRLELFVRDLVDGKLTFK
ncbi:aminoglycoside phosphotransferase family protein [Bhargavaea cecembensis]|uniref:aminoglycoside phosphotransferase family protein n=1 Tax=Bhargavaea cecembensis TaxID=394098 RepID=UPI0006945494|nr:aminoglycoside phosphotransferase family protein [Bhargavaea cecembensis]